MTVRVGVDIDTWKVTLCAVAGRRARWESAPLRSSGHDLVDALRQTSFAIPLAVARLGLLEERGVEFYVERGRGMHRNADFDLGAVYGAVIVALARACPNGHVASMALSEWKKAVTAAVGMTTKRGDPGLGMVKKEVANAACVEILADWQAIPDLLSADELDAFGIAYAATEREEAHAGRA